jgi:hypothetical protein
LYGVFSFFSFLFFALSHFTTAFLLVFLLLLFSAYGSYLVDFMRFLSITTLLFVCELGFHFICGNGACIISPTVYLSLFILSRYLSTSLVLFSFYSELFPYSCVSFVAMGPVSR